MPHTPKVETTEYAAMLRRMVRAYGRRLADADPTDLAAAIQLQDELSNAIGQAVAAMRDTHGYSWADVAAELGVTRQAAFQRYGRYCTQGVA